jgi:hypothetical protein
MDGRNQVTETQGLPVYWFFGALSATMITELFHASQDNRRSGHRLRQADLVILSSRPRFDNGRGEFVQEPADTRTPE